MNNKPHFPEYALVNPVNRDELQALLKYLYAYGCTWESGDSLLGSFANRHDYYWDYDEPTGNLYSVRRGQYVAHSTIKHHARWLSAGYPEQSTPGWVYISVEDFIAKTRNEDKVTVVLEGFDSLL